MGNIHTITDITRISENATDVESDVESNVEPSDRQNSDIDYHTPGSSGTSSSLEQSMNKSASIPSNFEKILKVSSSNKIQKLTVNGINKMQFSKMQTSMKYHGIHTSLYSNQSRLQYQRPTLIQNSAIPIFMNGRDIIARTPIGSGKTIAFLLPILSCILENLSEINGDGHRSDPLAVIVVPTKQRVEHIYNIISRLSEHVSIKCGPLFGINSVPDQKQYIQNGVHIIVADPESLAGFVSRDWITFSALRIIVLDDADLLLKVGYKPEIEFILNNKTMVSTEKRRTALFLTTVDKDVQQLAMTYLKSNYVSIDIEDIIEVEGPNTMQEI